MGVQACGVLSLAGCVGIEWRELSTSFSLLRSMLLQLRVNSVSWGPVAFKIPVKKALYLPLTLHTLGSFTVSSAFEAGLLREKRKK